MIDRQTAMVAALSGAINGALMEAFGEMAKELRTYAGRDFDKQLDVLEARSIRSVENAPFDGFPEGDQLLLVEQTRAVIVALFREARRGHGAPEAA